MATISNNEYAGSLTEGLSSLITVGANDVSLFQVGLTKGSKHRFGYTASNGVLQNITSSGLCAATASGSNTLDFVNLDLQTYLTRIDECRDAFYGTDYAQAQNGILSQEIDGELVNSYATEMVGDFANGLQLKRWSGTVAGGDAQDGIIAQIKAAGAWVVSTNEDGYQKVATTALTSANIIAEIQKIIAALPNEVTSYKGFKIVLGSVGASALRSASMVAVGVNNLVMNGNNETGLITDNFFGYSVYEAKGLNDGNNESVILGGVFEDSKKGVLKLAMNSWNDSEAIRVRTLEDDKVRFDIAAGMSVGVIPNLSQVAMNA